jgi:DNA-binding response OmpR family regulator
MCAAYLKEPYRILIVDDDVDFLMLLERKLVQQGFEVETAVALPEAEEIIDSFWPHILLLDINLNGADGRQLSFRIKQANDPHAPRIIMMSGYDYSAVRAALFGADELIVKPLHFEFLVHRIEHHLTAAPQAARTHDNDAVSDGPI